MNYFKKATSIIVSLGLAALLYPAAAIPAIADTNAAPTLASGVSATYTGYVEAGNQFSFAKRFESLFVDANNDELSYWVSINDGTLTQSGFDTVYGDLYDATGNLVDNNAPHTGYVYTTSTAGTIVFKFFADDGTDLSTDYVMVSLTVGAANSGTSIVTEVKSAAGVEDLALYDSAGNEVYETGSVDYTSGVRTTKYVLQKDQTYSFSGVPVGSSSASGASFTVPTATNVDGSDEDPDTVFVKQVNYRAKLGSQTTYTDASNYELTLKNASDTVVPTVANSNDSTFWSALVYAHGNAELYNLEAVPNDSSYATLYQGNLTYTQNTTVQTVNLTIPVAVTRTITAPSDATVQAYVQLRNFQLKDISDTATVTTSGSNKVWSYTLPQSGYNFTYRVSKSGYITKAGFFNLASSAATNTDVTFASDDVNNTTNSYGTYDTSTTIGSRSEDSVLLNISRDDADVTDTTIGGHNCMPLANDETFCLRPYRAAWQIINNDTSNVMIEPDFNFDVIEGSSLVSLSSMASDSGLAQYANWRNVTAASSGTGTAIVKVTYDAIDIGGNTSYGQRYYASDAARTGYAVFNVGIDNIPDLKLNAATSGSSRTVDWDCEMDTVYYTGSSGTFSFTPTTESTISSVTYSNTEGGTYTAVPSSSGTYNMPVAEGYNMLKITTSDGAVECIPIRAAKVTVTDSNGNALTTASVNTQTKIHLGGLYMPVPKFSGIYNPMMNQVNYTVTAPDGTTSTVSSASLQYNFISKNTITWTPTQTGTYTFSAGYHSMRMFCNATEKWGHHRMLGNTGIGANFNAGLVYGYFNIYPTFTITVS